MAHAWPRRRRFSSTLSERMTPISLICVTCRQICLPKASCCRYGHIVPVRDSVLVMTRPLNGAPLGIFPPCSVDPMGSQRSQAGTADGRVEGPAQCEPGQGDAALSVASSGRERMVRTATVQAETSHRPARNAARRGFRLGSFAKTTFLISIDPCGSAASLLNGARSRSGALRRFAGQDLRIPSPNIALAPFAASPPSTRTGRGSVPMDRRDVEAGPGATSFTWPTKCLSMHPIPRRPGLWCCAGTA